MQSLALQLFLCGDKHSILREVAGLAVFVALSGCQNTEELRCTNLLQKAGEKLILHLLHAIFYFLGLADGVGWVSQWFTAVRHAAGGKCIFSSICLVPYPLLHSWLGECEAQTPQ